MVQRLGQIYKGTFFPEMIVAGISSTHRTRDFTPTNVQPEAPCVDAESAKVSGGGDKFASFIENELIPNIDSKYPTNQHYKMLVGHSFGGLEVINIVANHTSIFNSYICIDPSIWRDDMNFLKITKNTLTKKNF